MTVGHLVARKRHADVLRALWLLRDRLPALRYLVVGDGPERAALERARRASSGSPTASSSPASSRTPRRCARARPRTLFVLPSVDEAFGVAYVEAMAAGRARRSAAAASRGREEIAAAGDGIRLVPPGDPEALAARDRRAARRAAPRCRRCGALARATVARAFTWDALRDARRSPPTRTRCAAR